MLIHSLYEILNSAYVSFVLFCLVTRTRSHLFQIYPTCHIVIGRMSCTLQSETKTWEKLRVEQRANDVVSSFNNTSFILKTTNCVCRVSSPSFFFFLLLLQISKKRHLERYLSIFWFCGSIFLRWVCELSDCFADEIIVEACFRVCVNWGFVELATVRGYQICDRQRRVFLPWCQVRGWHCSCLFRCY